MNECTINMTCYYETKYKYYTFLWKKKCEGISDIGLYNFKDINL